MRAFLNALLSLATDPKTVKALQTSVVLSPVLAVVEKYFFSDWDFLGFLLVLIFVDTLMGIQRSWVTHTISSRGFSRIFVKLCVYANLLILTHVMTHFTVHGEPNQIFKWFDYFMYSCMMAREALSILEHIALIEPRLVPKPLLKRLALISQEGLSAALAERLPAPPAPEPAPITPPIEEGVVQ